MNLVLADGDHHSGGGWAEVHAPTCPRSNLPDVVSTQRSRLTVECGRQHDSEDKQISRTGILKHGKLWKRSEVQHKKNGKEDRHRRNVRFSGRDEYTTVESSPVDDYHTIPNNISPRLIELGMLLGKDPWQLDLGSAAHDHHMQVPPDHPKHHVFDACEMEDDHIAESVKRYEEMRRRIASGENRANEEENDELEDSTDRPPVDPATAESRIRRLENADIAHVAGGILRSNSEVRRAIEQNALRRSLSKFSDARKKDTNKNDKNEKLGSSILEKLKWLTATEDLTNGNSDNKSYSDPTDDNKKVELQASSVMSHQQSVPPTETNVVGSITQYRQLAEMFNQSTSVRPIDMKMPSELHERNYDSDMTMPGCSAVDICKIEPLTSTYTAVPIVSFSDVPNDEDSDKLLYSGGVRYTREGTLMPPRRKELSVNKILGKVGKYTLNDIDEALHDDRSSSVPSSSQSSPRLSGRSDMDGTSTTESGYSSNDANGEYYSSAHLDELAEFVRQDASRLERLRLKYMENDDQDHGFGCRPAVKGIKPRYSSVSDALQPVAGHAKNAQHIGVSNQFMTWQGKDSPQESLPQRSRPNQIRSSTLPSVHEDIPYSNVKHRLDQHRDCLQDSCCHTDYSYSADPSSGHLGNSSNSGHSGSLPPEMEGQRDSTLERQCKSVDGYSLNTDPRSAMMNCPMSHDPEHQHEIHGHHDFQNSMNSGHFGSTQSLQTVTARAHHPSCAARRPISLHDQMLSQSGNVRPTDLPGRPHSSLGQYTGNAFPDNSIDKSSHPPLASRGSFPINPHKISSPTQYQEMTASQRHNAMYQQSSHCTNPVKYPHSPQEMLSPSQNSPVGTGGMSFMACYPKAQPRSAPPPPTRCYSTQWGSSPSPAVPSHLSYTTPLVPQTGTLTKQFSDVLSKVDVLRDERGVPEGASSSPRSSYDAQYSGQSSPPREQNFLARHSALPLDLSS